jgi:hypothetical protein
MCSTANYEVQLIILHLVLVQEIMRDPHLLLMGSHMKVWL